MLASLSGSIRSSWGTDTGENFLLSDAGIEIFSVNL